jgi:hypothetical protein
MFMKKNLLLIFLLFIALLSSAADWTKVSISVSAAKDFTFLKIDDNTCYAFIVSGTYPNYASNILKTVDRGGTWTPVTQTGLNLGDNVYKAVNRGSVLYVISVEGLYKSTDNCATWTLINNSKVSGVNKPADIFVDGNTIYVACPAMGLYSTNDDFATLTTVTTGFGLAGTTCVSKINNVLFAATSGNFWNYSGSNWSMATGLPVGGGLNILQVAMANGRYYLTDQSKGIYTSTDGQNWTAITTSSYYFYAVAVTNNYLLATQSNYKFVFSNTATLSEASVSGLPDYFAGQGLVVLGSNVFVGGYTPMSAADCSIYKRALSTIIPITGVADLQPKTSTRIFPNPANQFVTFELAGSSLPNASITISSETGQVLSKSNFTDRSITIGLEKFASGLYIYRIFSDKQPIESGKLLIKK